MSTNYPASADDNTTLPNPTATSTTLNVSLSGGQSNQNDAIKAVEAKLGTGASTPTNNTLMYGNGTGTSAWTQLTSSQLASSLSDETGTGKAVFGTSPTLITPAVDTINESTPGNGVTVAGLNVKSGVLSAPSTAIGNNGVTAANLATSAITLGYAQITGNITTTSTSQVLATGLTVTVTIPAGGRRVKITGFGPYLYNNGSNYTEVGVWDGTVGSGTQIGWYGTNGTNTRGWTVFAVPSVPSSGSKTYSIGWSVTAGTGTLEASSVRPAFILVEAI